MSMRRGNRSLLGERVFMVAAWVAVVLPLVLLAYLLGDVMLDAVGRLSWDFIVSFPSRKPELAGVFPALVGSFYLILLTVVIALPIGVGAAIYLEEYGGRSQLASFVEINIANLAGVPSVIYGLLGLGLFVRALNMDRSLIAGACTMALLVLPVVVVVSREALRTVPSGLREAAVALGATRWQMIRQVILPMAYPGILTGAILALSRAIGETAPLVVVGALTYVTFVPDGIDAPFTALPIQIFNWISRPQQGFMINAAAGITVLLVSMMALNALAVIVRNRLQAKTR